MIGDGSGNETRPSGSRVRPLHQDFSSDDISPSPSLHLQHPPSGPPKLPVSLRKQGKHKQIGTGE